MNPRPCTAPARARKPKRTAALLAAWCVLALLLLAAVPAQAQPEQPAPNTTNDDRGVAPGPARHVLVKAVGQGATAQEAEDDALRTARVMAARHYAGLGGAAALDPTPQGQRILASHTTPPIGFATVRAVVLVELRLRGLAEPPPAALALPVLRITASAGQVQAEANRACEVMFAIDAGKDAEPEILPGGGGAAYRLAPGKPMQQPLPKATGPAILRVLACTGGLDAPAVAPSLDEALAKARGGKPRPTVMRGVVSECVEVRTPLPAPSAPTVAPAVAPADLPKRSMRQKGSLSPVNMTGAAGREAGLPVPAAPAKDMP